MNVLKLCVCTAVYNVGDLVRYVVQGVVKSVPQGYEIRPIVVDSGSMDRSREIAVEEWRSHGYEPRVVVGRFNVSQARNVCLDIAIEEDCDALLIIDHDVIPLDRDVIALATEVASKLKAIVAVPYRFARFASLDEVIRYVASNYRASKCISFNPVPWTVTGFMVMPREVLRRVRFEEGMNFRDDTIFGLKSWLAGVPILMARPSDGHDLAIDVSIGRGLDVYSRLGMAEYLSSIDKKVLSDVYRCITSRALGRSGCSKLIAKYMVAAGWIPGATLASILVILRLTPLAISIALASGLLFLLLVVKECMKLRKPRLAMVNALKISVFALATLALFPLVYMRHRKEISMVLRELRRLRAVEACRS